MSDVLFCHCFSTDSLYLILLCVTKQVKNCYQTLSENKKIMSNIILSEAAVQRCSEKMQQVYKRSPMQKCDSNKAAKQLY